MKLFNQELIPLDETRSFDPLFLDYLKGNNFLKNFYGYEPAIANFKKKSVDRSGIPVNRKLLVEVLKEQYNQLGSGLLQEVTMKNIETLARENTFTVTTGHQLNIFTGPLYFIYKIISTINLAAKLEKELGLSVVPVYWMATEDHDMAEIDHIRLFGTDIRWITSWKGPAGHAKCEGLDKCIDEIGLKIGDQEHGKEIMQLLRDCYKPDFSLSEATRRFVHALFGKYGLIILDPDDARLKSAARHIFLDDLVNHSASGNVEASGHALEAHYKVQVHPRLINLFYLGPDYRERIVEEGAKYTVINHPDLNWDKTGIENELKEHPERFSPNVVLRPPFQEFTLPNLAYIGGPSEIAYWLEYKTMFDHYGISYPVLIPRRNALIIDSPTSSRLRKLGIDNADVFLPYDEWVRRYLSKGEATAFSMEDVHRQMELEMDKLAVRIAAIDPSLKAPVDAEKQRIRNALKGMEEKALRAQKKKNETSLSQLQKLKDKLFPGQSMQERIENFIPFYAKFGNVFLDELVSAFDPLDFRFLILTESTDES